MRSAVLCHAGSLTAWSLALLGLLHASSGLALGQPRYVDFAPAPGGFALAAGGTAATLVVDSKDFPGVRLAAENLRADVERVTGVLPGVSAQEKLSETNAVLIGTIGHSEIISRLIREHKIDVSAIAGKWESFFVQVVPAPLPGVARALVICGSDKRGTIYGIYDLSEQIGVSPWHYWADLPARRHSALYVKAGRYIQGEPSVKYRGIFLNDEWPDLSQWVREKYGNAPGYPAAANYGREFYAELFELILRLKGNYLWPAMWDNAFNEDDPENPRLADEYGIVMGTSHQEPMLRAQQEWDRRYQKDYGSWNYAKYPQLMEEFWREGVRRNKRYESLITIGLRGANDTPMASGGPQENQALLQTIVKVQRRIIAEEVDPDVTRVPQLWCLYKEVLDYYAAGMRVPDDVTLLWPDDNWGNLRRLPTAAERMRSGGAGIYYHFDYHGAPRSYQWLNTNPIAKIWDQMSLAAQYGADRIWIVNVGHFKGYEFPTEYFMHLAWNTRRWSNEDINEYTRLWAAREFGPAFAGDIAGVMERFTKFSGRRKPELLDAATYSLVNYREFDRVLADFDAIEAEARGISQRLPESERPAFYELILFPIQASAQLNAMYLAAAKNALFAKQGRASANDWAARTRAAFQKEMRLIDSFNHSFLGGKWDHFMDQPVIGYTGWLDPPHNNMDAVALSEVRVAHGAAMGVAVEGSAAAVAGGRATLPAFDVFNRQRHYIDIFNKGDTAFEFSTVASQPWIVVDGMQATVDKDRRIWIGIDWARVSKGVAEGTVTVSGGGAVAVVKVRAFKPVQMTRESVHGFVEGDGVVAIEPEHYTGNRNAGANRWVRIEDYGRTLSGMRSTGPPDAPSASPGKDSPRLEYGIYSFTTGTFDVITTTSPTLNFVPGRGLRFALSLDDAPPRMVEVVPEDAATPEFSKSWVESVEDNARYTHAAITISKPGYHTLKYWMIDPGVVLQKIVVNAGGLRPSYLGPPESFHRD